MLTSPKILLLINTILLTNCNLIEDIINDHGVDVKSFIFWPNATLPFYINPDHFDHEQSLTIMTALSMFSFKTCLKFAPVMSPPADSQHALVFTNPGGKRRCDVNSDGHSISAPHEIEVGYECLRSPYIDMVIMRALGFPFEHNRDNRDRYIDILMENIEPGAIQLYIKEAKLPLELRTLPYDVNSVMHFGTRDHSKNGHKTIIFKDHKVQQNRVGLTETDLRKIEIVYGPECLKRDRQDKIELCQSYPGVARRKRDISLDSQSLRVNPEITAPPDINATKNLHENLKDLGIESEVQDIIDSAYKVSSLALKNAREKYCNGTKSNLRTDVFKSLNESSDVLGIVEVIADYARSVVDHALANLTVFCEVSESFETYLRMNCPYDDGSSRCRQTYRSTKSGAVRYSTQHRPTYYQSTKLPRTMKQFVHYGRTGKDTNVNESERSDTTVPNEADKNNDTSKIMDVGVSKPMVRRKRHLEKHSIVHKLENERTNNHRRGNVDTVGLKTIKKRAVQVRSVKPEMEEDVKMNITENNLNTENSTSHNVSEVTNALTIAGKEYSNNRKNFQERRFRSKNAKMKNSEYWDASSVLLDNVPLKKKPIKQRKIQKKKLTETEEVEERQIKKKQEKRNKVYTPKTVKLSKANKEFYDERKWPKGVVYYVIKNERNYDIENMRERLEEVNSILKEKTCVKLQEITEEEAKKRYKDYLLINASPDYVTGRVGGKQVFGNVELFRGGQHRQHTAMMVMAMLGFYFEVSRHDRDRHIRVHTRHIRPDKLHHFEKIREDSTLPLPYDYKSATHPAWQFWRKLGKTGISTVATFKEQDPDGSVMKSLGQNEELLSEIDIIKINSVYGTNCFDVEKSDVNERNGRGDKKLLKINHD